MRSTIQILLNKNKCLPIKNTKYKNKIEILKSLGGFYDRLAFSATDLTASTLVPPPQHFY